MKNIPFFKIECERQIDGSYGIELRKTPEFKVLAKHNNVSIPEFIVQNLISFLFNYCDEHNLNLNTLFQAQSTKRQIYNALKETRKGET